MLDQTSTLLPWQFPMAHCHEGIPLGNGTFGALVWAAPGDATLRLTVNRADYWLHAGGWEWPQEATYANLRRWLAAEDEATLRRVFEGRASADSPRPDRPTRLPMGRVDVALPPGATVSHGSLDLDTGEASVGGTSTGAAWRATLVVARHAPLLAFRFHGRIPGNVRAMARPPDAPEVVAHLHAHGFPEPERFGDGRDGGWVQVRPDEPALCVAWRRAAVAGDERSQGPADLSVVAAYGPTGDAAVATARAELAAAERQGYDAIAAGAAAWWRAWRAQAARVELDDPTASLLYRLGMYKLGCLSVPGSPAASLQGPWVEEHHLPPWSGDYHFNMNVQECYWPAYAGNHLETLEPLAAMLHAWVPRMRENARRYVGVDDGLLLPHAVDDRCTCMGGFWTGQTDHGSTAWAAQLLWQRYRHSLDRDYLRDVAYPLLRGAMRTYEAMLEPDGDALCLPVGVSPEFGGSGARAYGRNPSFQLACAHAVCRALLEASDALGFDGDDQRRWREVARRLPLGNVARVERDIRGTEMVRSAVPRGDGELILWDGQPLTESHRHHAHLMALYPFGLLDPAGSDADRALVANTLRRLTLEGMGAWTGWCLPWAAILYARGGQRDHAGLLLEIFRRTFMGRGYYTTHDAVFRGLSVMASRPDIMQLDAALGASATVLELLAETNAPGGGVIRAFGGTPSSWADASFDNLRADGAFILDARREGGETTRVRARSEAGGTLRLAHPFGGRGASVKTPRGTLRFGPATEVPVLQIETSPGDELAISPA